MDPAHIELGLERVKSVWNSLPDLPEQTKVVVVGGTNGKGSCVLAMEHLLKASGYKVGAYLSPHLVRFNERIRFDKTEISDQSLAQHLEAVDQARGTTQLTYFEFTTLAALSYFAAEQPDIVILEVGLGGRLDAVNILPTDLAVLVSVDLDHQAWLGHDRESIGWEKAGIFRRDAWAVVGEDMPNSVLQYAWDLGAKLLVEGEDFSIRDDIDTCVFRWGLDSWEFPGAGISRSSLAAALCAVRIVTGGLAPEVLNTLQELRLPARFQRISIGNRDFILDSAHNPAAAANLSSMLSKAGLPSVDVVLGMMADKDSAGFVRALKQHARRWLVVAPDNSRARPYEELKNIIASESSAEIVEIGSLEHLKIDDLSASLPTLVCGSFYTVGEFLKYHAGDTSA